MSRLDALRTLKKAVEDGTATPFDFSTALGKTVTATQCHRAWSAYYDDLNAARALHDAVRPGWAWRLQQKQDGTFVCGIAFDGIWHASIIAEDAKPARALLLADIASLIDEEGK
jgi:hypothetical protein